MGLRAESKVKEKDGRESQGHPLGPSKIETEGRGERGIKNWTPTTMKTRRRRRRLDVIRNSVAPKRPLLSCCTNNISHCATISRVTCRHVPSLFSPALLSLSRLMSFLPSLRLSFTVCLYNAPSDNIIYRLTNAYPR